MKAQRGDGDDVKKHSYSSRDCANCGAEAVFISALDPQEHKAEMEAAGFHWIVRGRNGRGCMNSSN